MKLEDWLQREMCKHKMNTAASFFRKQRAFCVILAAQYRSANINKALLQVGYQNNQALQKKTPIKWKTTSKDSPKNFKRLKPE